MELEEYKFDHFKNIDEVMYYLNYWYNEEDAYSINRYLSLKDFNYISNKYQELKKQLEATNEMIEKCGFVNIEQVMLNYCGLLSQQKEFIKYMNDIIKDLEMEDVADEELKGYLIQRIDTFKEILQKYKEIIGVSDETN